MILRKIIEIVATTDVKFYGCTIYSILVAGAYSAPPDSIAGLKGPTSKGKGKDRRVGRAGNEEKGGEVRGGKENGVEMGGEGNGQHYSSRNRRSATRVVVRRQRNNHAPSVVHQSGPVHGPPLRPLAQAQAPRSLRPALPMLMNFDN